MEVQTDGKPKPRSQRNFTDPESSIMPGPHGFVQAYNCQAVVEPVFGQIRVGQGFNRISFRGLKAASAEWKLVAACHNLLKIFRLAPMAPA